MAVYRVGMKVRVLPCLGVSRRTIWSIGDEGVIVSRANRGDGEWWIVNTQTEGNWPCRSDYLAPLLPPDEAADAFLARLKRLGSEPVNDAPKVTEKVGAK